TFIRTNNTWHDKLSFCSHECRRLSRKSGGALNELRVKTCQKTHGVDAVFQREDAKAACWSDTARKKRTATLIERYGVDNAAKNAEINMKAQTTCFERHGWKTPFQSNEIQSEARRRSHSFDATQKREETCLTRY